MDKVLVHIRDVSHVQPLSKDYMLDLEKWFILRNIHKISIKR